MVCTLADAGYLVRHPRDKTYSLGPALIAVGHAAAARQFEAVEFASDQMRGLSEELGLQCVASTTMGDEIVLLASSGESEPFGLRVQVGERLPLAPPFGTVFMAWAPPEEIESWLRRLGPNASASDLERYRRALATIRERGYSLAMEADARRKLGKALAQLDRDVTSAAELRRIVEGLVAELGHEEYILSELETSASYRLAHIAAPVFGPDGRVVLALTLIGFPGQLSAEQVPAQARSLCEAAARVTRSLRGRPPGEERVAV
jgi:DNA-binding IclR family transcriptional regulator